MNAQRVEISASSGFPRRSFPTALVPGSPPALLCLRTLLVRESRGGKGTCYSTAQLRPRVPADQRITSLPTKVHGQLVHFAESNTTNRLLSSFQCTKDFQE